MPAGAGPPGSRRPCPGRRPTGRPPPHGGRRRGRTARDRARRRAPRPSPAARAPCVSTSRLSTRTTSQMRSSAPVTSKASSRSATSSASGASAAATAPSGDGQRAQPAAAVAGHHRRRAREQVAEVVAELALVALVDARDRGRAVLAERDRPRTPEPHRVGTVDVDQVERIDDVPERLRDLLSSSSRYPWTNSCRGGSYPAASSIAGQ